MNEPSGTASTIEQPGRVRFRELTTDRKIAVIVLEAALACWLVGSFIVIGTVAVMGTAGTGGTVNATAGVLLVPILHVVGLGLGIYLGVRRSTFVPRVVSPVIIAVVIPPASFFLAYVVINSSP